MSSIDPHAVLNNFVFLRLTHRGAIATAPILAMFFVYVTHSENDVISFRSAIKVKVSLGLAKVKP